MAAINHKGAPSLAREEDYEQTSQILNQRVQWLRAAVLGANVGLVSIAALMMGIGEAKADVKVMLLAGFAGAVAGACGMAMGEFVSVYTQYEVEVTQMRREMSGQNDEEKQMEKKMKLLDPIKAAFASALSFSIGALIPLLAAAFITDYKIRLMVLLIVATLALTTFGFVGAVLGKIQILRSCVRAVFGGWIAMVITFGFTTVLCSWGLELYG